MSSSRTYICDNCIYWDGEICLITFTVRTPLDTCELHELDENVEEE
ncbi:MAG: hypothetical protein ABIJ40_03580 [Bacteroidota bacterium]